jgi:hypothetical protein
MNGLPTAEEGFPFLVAGQMAGKNVHGRTGRIQGLVKQSHAGF